MSSSPKPSSSSSSSFGQAVESLLETYSRCLSLLKSLRRQQEEEEKQQAASASSQQQQAQLNSSLRSDRASIRRAYSSRLLQDGARLDQGDAAARSSLRRVIKRLTTALADVVRILARRQPRSADYDSLVALSSMSSVDAIRTINDLSSRISGAAPSPSTSSVSTRSNAGSRRTRSRHSSGAAGSLGKKGATVTNDRRSHSRSGSSSSSTGTRSVRRSRKSNNKRRDQHHDPHHPPHASTVAAGAAHRPKAHGTKRDSSGSSSSTHRRRSSANTLRIRDDANGHRLSMATMSSDSTKLGEVRRRRSTMGLKQTPRVTYPLYPYHYRAEDKPKKKWWGVFGG